MRIKIYIISCIAALLILSCGVDNMEEAKRSNSQRDSMVHLISIKDSTISSFANPLTQTTTKTLNDLLDSTRNSNNALSFKLNKLQFELWKLNKINKNLNSQLLDKTLELEKVYSYLLTKTKQTN